MLSFSASLVRPATAVTISALLCLCVVVFALTSNYRVIEFDTAYIWQVSLPRVLVAVSAGIAFGVAGATVKTRKHSLLHAIAYAISMSVVSGLLLADMAGWNVLGGLGLSILFITLVGGLSKLVFRDSATSTVTLAVLLGLAFSLNVFAYAGASVTTGALSAVSKWVLGELAYSTHISVVGLVSVSSLAILVAYSKWQNWTLPLLVGIGLGMAGPLFFVGWLAPTLLGLLNQQLSKSSLVFGSALIGASLVVLMDSLPRLLLGGYAPPLSVSLAVFATPVVIWCHHKQLVKQSALPRWIIPLERVTIFATTLFFVFVLVHVVLYAQANT